MFSHQYAPVGGSQQQRKQEGVPAVVACVLAGATVLALVALSGDGSSSSPVKLWSPIRAGGAAAPAAAWLPPAWVGQPPPLDPLSCKPQLVVAGVTRGGSTALGEYLNGTAPLTAEDAAHGKQARFLNGTIPDPPFLRRYSELPLEQRKFHPALLGSRKQGKSVFDAPLFSAPRVFRETFPGLGPGDDPLAGRCSHPRPAVRFEAAPGYLGSQLAVEQMKRYIPEARFVLLLREPLSRAISHLSALMQLQNPDKSVSHEPFSSARPYHSFWAQKVTEQLKAEADELQRCHEAFQEHTTKPWNLQVLDCMGNSKSLLSRTKLKAGGVLIESLYDLHLPRWFNHFSPQQTLVWSSLALQRAPREHGLQLVQWLGLDPAEINQGAEWVRLHESQYLPAGPIPPELMRRLEQLVAPHASVALATLRQWGYGEAAAQLERAWAEERTLAWNRLVRLEAAGDDSWGDV